MTVQRWVSLSEDLQKIPDQIQYLANAPQDLQHRQGMIGALLDEVLQGTSLAHDMMGASEQIQTLDICVRVLNSVR